MTQVLTTNASQPHRLRQRLQEAGVQHGQRVTGKIEVRVEGAEVIGGGGRQPATVFFCNMPPIEVHQITGVSDGEELPQYAVLSGLNVGQDGYYRVPVEIYPNGALNVTVTGEPVLVGHEAAMVMGDVIGG